MVEPAGNLPALMVKSIGELQFSNFRIDWSNSPKVDSQKL